MRTIAIINQKGGCGKTTTAINLSAMLARAGERTLLIDLDSQSHCAAGYGIPENRIDMDIGDAMLAAGNKNIDLVRLLWQPASNLDLAPSRMRLAGLEATRGGLANLVDKERRLAEAIKHIATPHDLILIDCAPSIGLLTYNALVAADVVMIPVETSYFSLQGATRQVNTVKSLSRKLGIHRPVWILPTIHDEGNEVANDLLAELYRRFGERVIPVCIRRDPKLREAASFGQSIIDYAPGSSGFEDYAKLADWVRVHWTAHGEVDAALAESLAAEEELGAEGSYEQDAQQEALEAAQEEGDQASTGQLVGQASHGGSGEANLAGSMGHAGTTAAQMMAQAAALAQQTRSSLTQRPSQGAGNQYPPQATEPKPGNRAEDVARRAQEFLRKVATGRTPEGQPVNHQSQTPQAHVGQPTHPYIPAQNTQPHTGGATQQPNSPMQGRAPFTYQPQQPPYQNQPQQPLHTQQPSHPQQAQYPQAFQAQGTHPQYTQPAFPSQQPYGYAPQVRQPTQPLRLQPDTTPVYGLRPGLEQLLGAHETNQGVLFVQPATIGAVVCIAGEFNGWSPTALPLRRNADLGVFELCIKLPAGKHHYRLVVDGVWTADPYNPQQELNQYNEVNSYIEVGAADSVISVQVRPAGQGTHFNPQGAVHR